MPEFDQLRIDPASNSPLTVEKWEGMVDKIEHAHMISIDRTPLRVGIGTNTPVAKLEVYGNANLTGTSNSDVSLAFYTTRPEPTKGAGSAARGSKNEAWTFIARNINSQWGNNKDFLLAYWNDKTWRVPLLIKHDTGNVGIGTTDPKNKLTVVGPGDSGTLNPSKWQAEIGTSGNGKLLIGSYNNQPAIQGHGTGTSYRLLLNPVNGKVGIRTADPQYDLDVNGQLIVSKWVRTRGQHGVFFEDFGGGFHMKDTRWIRTYGGKDFYHSGNIMQTTGTLIARKVEAESINVSTKLIEFQTFNSSRFRKDGGTFYCDTGKAAGPNDFEAGVVGFDTGTADIKEHETGHFMKVYMEVHNGRWRIAASLFTESHDDGGDENWRVDVMFVSKKISRRI